MNLLFTLIDYTTNSAGDSTQIDEPMGWDAINLHIMRDPNWHGFFNALDDSVGSLKFVGDGYSILKNAYDLQGAEADVKLLIEFQCAEGDSYEQLYYGQFAFATFKSQCGDLCMCECGIEAVDCLMKFRNRYDQQVDLDSTVPFDKCPCNDSAEVTGSFSTDSNTIAISAVSGHSLSDLKCIVPGSRIVVTGTDNDGEYIVTHKTISSSIIIGVTPDLIMAESSLTFTLSGCLFQLALATYTGLNLPIVLPAKTIRLTSELLAKADASYPYTIANPLPFGYRVAITPDWENVITEIENTYVGEGVYIDADPLGGGSGPSPDYGGFTAANPPDPFVYFVGGAPGSSLSCRGAAVINLKFDYSLSRSSAFVTVDFFRVYIIRDVDFMPPYAGGLVNPISGSTLIKQAYWDLTIDFGTTHSFNESVILDINGGETVWVWFDISMYTTVGGETLSLNLNTGSFFQMTIDSICSDTVCDIYLINEVMSRCVEAYTNDCMRVYSDYFGRTDAQPYPSIANGCGGQLGIANGKKIRNAPNTDGITQVKMTVSMKDTFEALNATNNIGMGLEVDPNRADHNLIRVEPVHYFFNDSILMSCPSIRLVKQSVDNSVIYSVYKGGYDKWETWNDNGLYDLFGSREYRTGLSQIANTLQQNCKWIASDYAIEFTRRLYGTTTSDWKYDDDIFFLCLDNILRVTDAHIIQNSPAPSAIYLRNIVSSQFNAGDSITISGTASNDGIYSITAVLDLVGGTTELQFAAGTFTTEGPVTFSIVNNTNPLVAAQQGVDNSANILFPETVLNYRLAPSRNAMRWIKTIFQSYRNFIVGAQLFFTQGGGNILAQGEVINDDGCRLESEVIQEQEDLNLSLFNAPEDNYPNFRPELITFDYPMSYQQYKDVAANPYGLIKYQCGNADFEYGWIEDMKYSPYTGMVSFTLRPKIAS